MATPTSSELEKVDALLIYRMFEDLSKKLGTQVQSISDSVTIMQRNSLKTNEMIEKLIASLAENRDQRYQQEIETLHGQLEIMRRQFTLMEQELTNKKLAKVDNLTTSQRMRQIATTQIAETEEDRILKRNQEIREIIKTQVIKPAITFFTLAVLGFVGYLFFLYILPALADFGAK